MPNKPRGQMRLCRQRNRRILVAILGCSLCVFGVLCGMFWEDLFDSIMAQEMTLRPDSQTYEHWKKPPFDLSLDIYLFNWTNPEDFSNLSTKPILEQLGPYRFTERPDKVDIVWHAENASVTYRKKSDFYFNPTPGGRYSLDDVVVTLNAVALSAAAKAKHWAEISRSVVNIGLNMYEQEMSVEKTVDELLFSGYSDALIDIARAIPIFGKNIEVPFDKFGWFYTRNGSADLTGVFNVHTGADNFTKMGQMHSWNYKTHTGYFEGHCGYTNGSAGEFQPPNLQVDGSVALFTPDMCRTLALDYVDSVAVEGILGYKYAGGPRSVDNGSVYPENLCFCGGECVPSGVMNISACRFGSPVFMSYPHFYNADPFYVNQVEGLEPTQDNHEFYMILDSKTGIALEVAARFQVNMLVEPIDGISLYEDIPRIFFPLIWFEQKVRITPELAGNLKMLYYVPLGGHIFAGICFAVGIILLSWHPIEYLCTRKKSVDLKSSKELDERVKASPDISPLLEKPSALSMPNADSNLSGNSNETNSTQISGTVASCAKE